MVRHDKSCPGCQFSNPYDSPSPKFHQEFGCPSLDKHGYAYKKDVTESASIMDKFNENFTKAPDQTIPNRGTGTIQSTEEVGIEHASDRRTHSPSITPATSNLYRPHDSVPTSAPTETHPPTFQIKRLWILPPTGTQNFNCLIQTTLLCLRKLFVTN